MGECIDLRREGVLCHWHLLKAAQATQPFGRKVDEHLARPPRLVGPQGPTTEAHAAIHGAFNVLRTHVAVIDVYVLCDGQENPGNLPKHRA